MVPGYPTVLTMEMFFSIMVGVRVVGPVLRRTHATGGSFFFSESLVGRVMPSVSHTEKHDQGPASKKKTYFGVGI